MKNEHTFFSRDKRVFIVCRQAGKQLCQFKFLLSVRFFFLFLFLVQLLWLRVETTRLLFHIKCVAYVENRMILSKNSISPLCQNHTKTKHNSQFQRIWKSYIELRLAFFFLSISLTFFLPLFYLGCLMLFAFKGSIRVEIQHYHLKRQNQLQKKKRRNKNCNQLMNK